MFEIFKISSKYLDRDTRYPFYHAIYSTVRQHHKLWLRNSYSFHEANNHIGNREFAKLARVYLNTEHFIDGQTNGFEFFIKNSAFSVIAFISLFYGYFYGTRAINFSSHLVSFAIYTQPAPSITIGHSFNRDKFLARSTSKLLNRIFTSSRRLRSNGFRYFSFRKRRF